jgi:hypothetical protein
MKGGTIAVIRSNLLTAQNNISISDTEITGSRANSEGGTLYLENEKVTVSFTDCTVYNTSAVE